MVAASAIIDSMATVIIRGIDDALKLKLRHRAARKGISMEQELRTIVSSALNEPDVDEEEHPVATIRRLVKKYGGVDHVAFPRLPSTLRPVKFSQEDH